MEAGGIIPVTKKTTCLGTKITSAGYTETDIREKIINCEQITSTLFYSVMKSNILKKKILTLQRDILVIHNMIQQELFKLVSVA